MLTIDMQTDSVAVETIVFQERFFRSLYVSIVRYSTTALALQK